MATATWLADIKTRKVEQARKARQRQRTAERHARSITRQWDPFIRQLLRELGETSWGANIPVIRRAFRVERIRFWTPKAAKEDDWRCQSWSGTPRGEGIFYGGGWRVYHESKEPDGSKLNRYYYEVWLLFSDEGEPINFVVSHKDNKQGGTTRTRADLSEESLKGALRRAYEHGPAWTFESLRTSGGSPTCYCSGYR